MAHRNRWLTLWKMGGSFHGYVSHNQRVYNFICGFIFLSPISGYIRYTRGILVHFMYEEDGVWAWSKRNGVIHQVMIFSLWETPIWLSSTYFLFGPARPAPLVASQVHVQVPPLKLKRVIEPWDSNSLGGLKLSQGCCCLPHTLW